MPEEKRETKAKGRRRERRIVARGRVYIQATFNNTIVTFTDPDGNVMMWGSPGSIQPPFKGSKRSTPYAAQVAAQSVAKKALEQGMREVDVFVKGPGPGREAAIRSIQAAGVQVRSITDVTPIPHNGCRPPKKRRI
jgi:small subunit ribosomal protein S11